MKAKTTSIKNYSRVIAAIGVMAIVAIPTARAQEITKYPSGLSSTLSQTTTGFVCEGNIQDKGDNRIYCTGPIYRADEYVAKYARQGSNQLVKLNEELVQLDASLDKLNKTSEATQEVLSKQVQAFNNDLKAYVEKRFRDLSKTESQSAAIQNLKKSLMEYIDQRLKGADQSPPPGPAAP